MTPRSQLSKLINLKSSISCFHLFSICATPVNSILVVSWLQNIIFLFFTLKNLYLLLFQIETIYCLYLHTLFAVTLLFFGTIKSRAHEIIWGLLFSLWLYGKAIFIWVTLKIGILNIMFCCWQLLRILLVIIHIDVLLISIGRN